MQRSILVTGGTSAIARALAHAFAARGDDIILAGRDPEELERSAVDLALRHGVRATSLPFHAGALGDHAQLVERADRCFDSPLGGLVLCHGAMPEESALQQDPELADRMMTTNHGSMVALAEAAVGPLAERAQSLVEAPFICAFGSVAGDRGRPSNAIYGASKAALATYCSGLRARLAGRGVRVITVKPGFVDTAMTWGRPGLFWVAQPRAVARDVMRGIDRDRAIVYTPFFWRFILGIIRAIPDSVFRRLSI